MTPNEKLEQVLHNHPNSPFLFVGSGFSQRYLGSPTWEGMLRHFSTEVSSFEYYLASADARLPRCASLLAKDYAAYWWKESKFDEQRVKFKKHILSNSSPLKVAIADYLTSQFKLLKDAKLLDELNALRAFNAEGIITTNWDCLLESLFPGYKVYIGQQSIVRQTPQNIGEIFKIHGCCTDPNSMVLTEEDYNLFKDKQAYLAAKLITIFVEHPVIFIGYSVSDPNILDLLRSILRGLGSEEVKSLQQNLIFVQRSKEGRQPGVTETILVVDETQLPITNLVTNDFVSFFSTLSQSKLKLPARVLRFCKEQLYEIVSSKEPSEKLCLANIDDIKDKDDIEFVVGIGVVGAQLAGIGYRGVSTRDLFSYLLYDKPELNAKMILDQCIPDLCNRNNFLPVFRYLHEAGITSVDESTNASVKRLATVPRNSFKTSGYAKAAIRETLGKDFDWIVNNLPPEKAAVYIPHLADDRIPLDKLKAFATKYFDCAFGDRYSTFYRKVFCLYDYLAFNGKAFST